MEESYSNYKILKKKYKDLKKKLEGGDGHLEDVLQRQREAEYQRGQDTDRRTRAARYILKGEKCCKVKLGRVGSTNVKSLDNDRYTGLQSGSCEGLMQCKNSKGEVITSLLKRDKKALCGTCQPRGPNMFTQDIRKATRMMRRSDDYYGV